MSDLEGLLDETGELEEVRTMAAKKILAADIRHMMDQRGISKAKLAKTAAVPGGQLKDEE